MAVFHAKRKGMKLLKNMIGATILSEQDKKDITDRMNKIMCLEDIDNISRDISNLLCNNLKTIREGIVKYNIEKKKIKFISTLAQFDKLDAYDNYSVQKQKNTKGTIMFLWLIEVLDYAIYFMENSKIFDKNNLEKINNIFEEISRKKIWWILERKCFG